MQRVLRRGLPALALGVVLALTVQGAALAATVNVSITNFAFTPATAKLKQGDTVHWTNDSPANHTSTSNGAPGSGTMGVGLWSSGTIPPSGNDTFDFVFTTASKYPYLCTIHPAMVGTVQVAMKATPASGDETTQFTITWGSMNPPAGFRVDVQIKRPGDAGFSNWMLNQTGRRATFVPDDGPGVYQFRARLENISTGGTANFSAAKKITVT